MGWRDGVLHISTYLFCIWNTNSFSVGQVLFPRTTRREAPMQREALPRGCARCFAPRATSHTRLAQMVADTIFDRRELGLLQCYNMIITKLAGLHVYIVNWYKKSVYVAELGTAADEVHVICVACVSVSVCPCEWDYLCSWILKSLTIPAYLIMINSTSIFFLGGGQNWF